MPANSLHAPSGAPVRPAGENHPFVDGVALGALWTGRSVESDLGKATDMTIRPKVAINGAGIGGLALAALLNRAGTRVQIFEQAKQFLRIGAGIQMSPNAMRVLRALGLEARLRQTAFAPPSWTHRTWDTGEN